MPTHLKDAQGSFMTLESQHFGFRSHPKDGAIFTAQCFYLKAWFLSPLTSVLTRVSG